MKRNNDVMRSDRLKQVMQEIDSTFDEKNLGISKFSRFCQEAAQRGLLAVTKLENGQLEVDLPAGTPTAPQPQSASRRSRRRRRPKRAKRPLREPRSVDRVAVVADVVDVDAIASAREPRDADAVPQRRASRCRRSRRRRPSSAAGRSAARQLELTTPHVAPRSPDARHRRRPASASRAPKRSISCVAPSTSSRRATKRCARATFVVARASCSAATRRVSSDRMFVRILKDAHDNGIIDLRRRGDDFEVARAAEAAPVAEQVARERAGRDRRVRAAAAVDAGAAARHGTSRGAGASRSSTARRRRICSSIGVVETRPSQRRAGCGTAAATTAVPPASAAAGAAVVAVAAKAAKKAPAAAAAARAAHAASGAGREGEARAAGGEESARVDRERRRARHARRIADENAAPKARRSRFGAAASRSVLRSPHRDRRARPARRRARASHARRRRRRHASSRPRRTSASTISRVTPPSGEPTRTEPLYGPPGIAYVYFIYGMYWCVNAVTRARRRAERGADSRASSRSVGIDLMRARRPRARRDIDLTNGPGKLCLALGIDGAQNRRDRCRRSRSSFAPATPVPDADVVVTPRIGITQLRRLAAALVRCATIRACRRRRAHFPRTDELTR